MNSPPMEDVEGDGGARTGRGWKGEVDKGIGEKDLIRTCGKRKETLRG